MNWLTDDVIQQWKELNQTISSIKADLQSH